MPLPPFHRGNDHNENPLVIKKFIYSRVENAKNNTTALIDQ